MNKYMRYTLKIRQSHNNSMSSIPFDIRRSESKSISNTGYWSVWGSISMSEVAEDSGSNTKDYTYEYSHE